MISMFKNLEFPVIKVLIVLSSLVSAPIAMGDISGEWNFSLNVQGQSGSAVATIRQNDEEIEGTCLLYTSPSPRDVEESRMPSSA